MKFLLLIILSLWINFISAQVNPLINNNWQTYQWPYNAYYPETMSGINGHMGNSCWVTAMARIVHYWEYPENGSGTLDFTDYGGNYWYCNYEELNMNFPKMQILSNIINVQHCFMPVVRLEQVFKLDMKGVFF